MCAEKIGSDVLRGRAMPNSPVYRRHDKEELKKKILIFVSKHMSRSNIPVTPTQVSEELGIVYPTSCILLLELVIEGHLVMTEKGLYRYFSISPEKKQGLEVRKR